MFSKSKSNSKVAKYTDPEKRFKLGECLGKGAFASVYRAIDRVDRKECAVKKMALNNPLCAGNPNIEYLIGKTLVHPCIVETLDSMQTKTHLFIQLSLVDGGDLFSQLDPSGPGLDANRSKRLMLELATGIQYLYSMDVVHADIKPENVLVHRGQLKICDFGLAGYTGTERHGTATGTGAYMAPELVNRKSTTAYHLREAHDVWSFGIVMYAVLFSDLPWEKARPRDEDFKLFCKKGGVSSKLYPFNTVTSAMRALLRGVLAIKASSRPSMAAVIDHMEQGHEWYHGGKKQPITSYGMREIVPADEPAFSEYGSERSAAKDYKDVADGASTVSSSDCPSIHDLEISPLAAGTAATYTSKSKGGTHAVSRNEAPLSKPHSMVDGLADTFGQLGVH